MATKTLRLPTLVTALSAITLVAHPATAADVRIKAPVSAPVAVASWTGFYVGLGIGLRSTETDATVTGVTQGAVDLLALRCAALAALGGCVTGEPINDTAFRVSPYLGYNWHLDRQWVVGVEGDIGFASKRSTLNAMFYPSSATGILGIGGSTFSVKTTWDASLRGRVGYLVTPTVLAYATGGAAWLHVESTSTCNPLSPEDCGPGGFSPSVITNSRTKLGWTVGAGFEAMLWSNWVARAEYRYADFGTISHTDTRTAPPPIASPEVASYDLTVRTHTATFGLAYKFGAADPVAAVTMPVKAPLKAPVLTAGSWTGLYVGAGLGVRSTQSEVAVTGMTLDGFDFFSLFCTQFASIGGCITSEPLNATAFRISPYVGFNWQFAPQWVGGIEGDMGWASRRTTLAGMYFPFGIDAPITNFAADTLSVRTTWDASLRGRIGYLVTPAFLVYATGGAAWLHVEVTSTCASIFCPPGELGPNAITNEKTQLGWTIGGGGEAQLWLNWFLRGEYRYADFGAITSTTVRSCATCATEVITYDLKVKTHTALFGLAYKFDWQGPVVAKY
jgi:outer membrane immunogenic protein